MGSMHIKKQIKQSHKVHVHKTKHHKNNSKTIHKQTKNFIKSLTQQKKSSIHINKQIKQNHKVNTHKTKHRKKHHKNNSKTIHKQTKNFMKSLTQQKKVLCTLVNR